MPLYEYVCGSCKKTTELIQRVGAPQLKVCPHCGGKLKKAISAPAIQFKGSGFYITDYARGSAAGSSSGSGSGSGEGEGSKSAGEKSDSKSDKSDKSEKAGKSEKVEKKTEKKEKKASSD